MGQKAFQGCTSLSDVMFLGKNLNQVNAMNNFNWGIADSRIIRAENQDPRETVFYGLYGSIESYLVEGSLDKNALATIGYWDSANSSWIKTPTYLKIGTAVTSIGAQAFQSCSNLVEVTAPSSVAAIGRYAFSICPNLERFVAPESLVETLEQSTFSGCVKLEYVSFNGCLMYIRTNAFGYCQSLKHMNNSDMVYLYDGTTEISFDAFFNSGIERVSMPNYCAECTSSSAFRNCNSLVEFEVRGVRTSEIPLLPNYPWGVSDTSIFHGTL